MCTQILEATTALNKPWDAPSNHILCGAHIMNTVVQEVLKVSLKATALGMEESDDEALANLAEDGGSVVLKVCKLWKYCVTSKHSNSSLILAN